MMLIIQTKDQHVISIRRLPPYVQIRALVLRPNAPSIRHDLNGWWVRLSRRSLWKTDQDTRTETSSNQIHSWRHGGIWQETCGEPRTCVHTVVRAKGTCQQ